MGIGRHIRNIFARNKWLAIVFPVVVLLIAILTIVLLFFTQRDSSQNSSAPSPSSSWEQTTPLPSESTKDVLFEPENIVLSAKEILLSVQDTYQITYTVHPENSKPLAVSFQSSDGSIAQVSDQGVVTGIALGEAEITVMLENGVSSSAHVVVSQKEIPVTSLSLSLSSITLHPGQTRQPLVTMLPENASDKSEQWSSSDRSIATVDSRGMIRAVNPGSCTITVQSVSNSMLSANVRVTVISSASSPTSSSPSTTSVPDPVGTFSSWNPSCDWKMVVINKDNKIPDSYTPQITSYQSIKIDQRVLPHLKAMMEAASADNAGLYIASGYRDIALQTKLYERKVKLYRDKGYSEEEARRIAATIVAKPGTSEHNTGLAIDFNDVDSGFCNTRGYRWLTEHAADYGFIMRYPTEKQSITNVIYEPWHFRYVGVENAKAIKVSGLCLEEYVSNLLS